MKKVCIITTTRADYGYLKPVIIKLQAFEKIKTQVLVTGTHLDNRYGQTIDEILKDGITPDFCVEIIEDDTVKGVLNTMANAVSKIGKVLSETAPDLVVLLGDRYETFAIAGACVVLNIPIAHISGGDVTYGAYDDMFRHSITKMSNIHFAGCEASRNRIIQLGENPETVFSVGEPNLEMIKNTKLMSKNEINKELNLDIEKTLLATFHPITMDIENQINYFKEVLDALVEQKEYFTLFTRSNADTKSSELNEMLNDYANQYPERIKVVSSLGVVRYLSAMKYCAAVIGNSSSGVVEAPSFQTPSINIGDRQKGRIQAKSTINTLPEKNAILKAIEKLSDEDFVKTLKTVENPYEGENTTDIITEKIIEFVTKEKKLKKFYDLVVK